MRLKVLVVEDREKVLKSYVNAIQSIIENNDLKQRYGITELVTHSASWYSATKEQLQKAISDPYDIAVFDLGIPEEPRTEERDSADDVENGMNLITMAKQTGSVKEIIVNSIFSAYKDSVSNAFRRGAVDFLSKPVREEPLTRAVLTAWERILIKKSASIFEDRIKLLASYAEKGTIYSFSDCFSRLTQSILREIDTSKYLLSERLGLDSEKDIHDPLIQNNAAIISAVEQARDEWKNLQHKIAFEETKLAPINLTSDLSEIIERLSPCLTAKHIEIDNNVNGEINVLSFNKDVAIILEEIIIGGLSETSTIKTLFDDTHSQVIDITILSSENNIEVCFRDMFAPIPVQIAEQINHGYRIETETRFGRIWGLSVAQQLAFRGGGRLEVRPLDLGNRIIYQIPIANYA
jgi:CheY-like chemotaxis protein